MEGMLPAPPGGAWTDIIHFSGRRHMAENTPNQGLHSDELSTDELEQASGGTFDSNGSQCFCSNTSCPPQQEEARA
jgi:hypothetical protein